MGSKEGIAKAVAKAKANNPEFLINRARKGGQAGKKENRAFFRDRDLARRAAYRSAEVRRVK